MTVQSHKVDRNGVAHCHRNIKLHQKGPMASKPKFGLRRLDSWQDGYTAAIGPAAASPPLKF